MHNVIGLLIVAACTALQLLAYRNTVSAGTKWTKRDWVQGLLIAFIVTGIEVLVVRSSTWNI